LLDCSSYCRCDDDNIRPLWWYDGNKLGADNEGGIINGRDGYYSLSCIVAIQFQSRYDVYRSEVCNGSWGRLFKTRTKIYRRIRYYFFDACISTGNKWTSAYFDAFFHCERCSRSS